MTAGTFIAAPSGISVTDVVCAVVDVRETLRAAVRIHAIDERFRARVALRERHQRLSA